MSEEKRIDSIVVSQSDDAYDEGLSEHGNPDNGDLKTKIARLESERTAMATREIQAVLDKYGVMLQAVAVIPASQVQIVPVTSK